MVHCLVSCCLVCAQQCICVVDESVGTQKHVLSPDNSRENNITTDSYVCVYACVCVHVCIDLKGEFSNVPNRAVPLANT